MAVVQTFSMEITVMNSIPFDVAFQRLLGNEGNFTANRNDPGNWTGGIVGSGELKGTNWGISAASYPQLDIRNLTQAQAKDIYFKDFWSPLQELHPALLFQVFDAAVNHGVRQAIKLLQLAVNVFPDGIMGQDTYHAVSLLTTTDLLMLFMAARLDFWASIPGTYFDDGWMRRAATNLRFAAQDA